MFPDLLSDDAFRLETRRLWLRWPRISDTPSLVKYAGDGEVARFTQRLPHPYEAADAQAFVLACRKENAAGSQVALALTRKGKPAELIGMIGVHAGAATSANKRLSIGYWLGAPFWGQGLMGEALDEMLTLTFQVTPAERVGAVVRKDNERSLALLNSRGFEIEDERVVNMPLRGGAFASYAVTLPRDVWMRRTAARHASAQQNRARASAED